MKVKVERVDFVSFLTRDIARARAFYADLLGLEVESEGEFDMEFRAGQVTLDIFGRGTPWRGPLGCASVRECHSAHVSATFR